MSKNKSNDTALPLSERAMNIEKHYHSLTKEMGRDAASDALGALLQGLRRDTAEMLRYFNKELRKELEFEEVYGKGFYPQISSLETGGDIIISHTIERTAPIVAVIRRGRIGDDKAEACTSILDGMVAHLEATRNLPAAKTGLLREMAYSIGKTARRVLHKLNEIPMAWDDA